MSKSLVKTVLDYRLDIDPEYQSWILIFSTITCLWIFFLPCYCGGLSSPLARKFAAWLRGRLIFFYIFAAGLNMMIMYLVTTWLPDWTPEDYAHCCIMFAKFMAKNLVKFATSIVIIAAFLFVIVFKDRIMLVLGLDHRSLFKCKFRDVISCWSGARFRPIELTIWKVEELAASSLFSGNNVYIEVFLGYNESLRTRVHNNAGSRCVIKEAMQLNYDEDDDEETLYIFVKNQKVMGGAELGRIELQPEQVKKVEEDSKGKLHHPSELRWTEEHFIERTLMPGGKIWFRIGPVDEGDEYSAGAYMKELTTC